MVVWRFYLRAGAIVLAVWSKYLILISMLIGGLVILFYMISLMESSEANSTELLKGYLGKIWFMPKLRGSLIAGLSLYLGSVVRKQMNMGWLEHYGPSGGAAIVKPVSIVLQLNQRGARTRVYLVRGSIFLV